MKVVVALCLVGLVALAHAESGAEKLNADAKAPQHVDDGSYAIGPAQVPLRYHAPAAYPIVTPWGSMGSMAGMASFAHPWSGMGSMGMGMMHPMMHGMMGMGYHPAAAMGMGMMHPAAMMGMGMMHPAAMMGMGMMHPAMMGFAEEKASVHAKGKAHSKAHGKAHAKVNPFMGAFGMYSPAAMNAYAGMFQQPMHQTQFPGAPQAKPGVNPMLGGTLNPLHPLGLPNHPYPFPMHAGLPNGKRHPRPFSPMGQYYPGQNALPYFPGMMPGMGMHPTYFPGGQNGFMGQTNPQQFSYGLNGGNVGANGAYPGYPGAQMGMHMGMGM